MAVRHFGSMSSSMRWWFATLLGCIGALALESYAFWGKWLAYPHVFSKLLCMLLIFGAYVYYRRNPVVGIGELLAWVPIVVVLNLVVYHPESLTVGGFLNHERGVSVTSAFLLVLPAVYFFNRYLTGGSMLLLICFFATCGLVVFLQHRTVWVSTAVALALNLLLLRKTAGIRLDSQRLLPMFLLPTIVILLGGMAAIAENPLVVDKLAENIADIQNPDKQGTGSWRLLQYESYVPYLEKYPIAGMRLEGFELPIQFYSPDSGEPVWDNFTGHHFHSFYLDRLFYFGYLGLALTIAVPAVLLIRRVFRSEPFTPDAAALVAYSLCSFLYGISYDWPIAHYALLGLALAVISPLPKRQPITPSAMPASPPPVSSAPAYASVSAPST
jgi:hypothetical protein